MLKKTLIIQGGGFRTCFTAGVLDAFRVHNYNPFNTYVAVSGGAIALSYYLSGQYKKCYEAMCILAEDKEFMNMNRLMSGKSIMDVDYFHTIASDKVPFDIDKAIEHLKDKELAIVMTNMSNGEPHYYHPDKKHWMEAVIASCTLPFVTKGSHLLHGEDYMDGGWSDPIPVEWAHNKGANDIVVIRTTPKDLKVSQSWPDYFGTLVFRSNDKLRSCFENNHLIYNASLDFMNSPPANVRIRQIAPETPLQTGTYSNSVKLISADYRYGMECGLNFIHSVQEEEK